MCAVLGFKCAVVRGPDVFPVGEEVTVNRNTEVSHLITAWKTLRGDVHAALRGRGAQSGRPRRPRGSERRRGGGELAGAGAEVGG